MSLPDGFHAVAPGKVAMVVTHLEMTAPAKRRGLECPQGLTFVPWQPDLATYRDTFQRVGADWLWDGRLLKSDAELSAILSDDGVQMWTLLKDGTPEAILELDFRTGDECELAYFGLTSKLIGTGAGGFLMDQALSIVWARPIKRLHVHTCSLDSPQALGFYIRSGFTPFKREVEIDDDPRITSVLDRSVASQIPII